VLLVHLRCPHHYEATGPCRYSGSIASVGNRNRMVQALDRVLRGGCPCGSITELVGPAGIGKTQLCLQLAAIAASLPVDAQSNQVCSDVLSCYRDNMSYCCCTLACASSHDQRLCTLQSALRIFISGTCSNLHFRQQLRWSVPRDQAGADQSAPALCSPAPHATLTPSADSGTGTAFQTAASPSCQLSPPNSQSGTPPAIRPHLTHVCCLQRQAHQGDVHGALPAAVCCAASTDCAPVTNTHHHT
jgi:Rad51